MKCGTIGADVRPNGREKVAAMKHPKANRQSTPSAPERKQYIWNIYHIKGTPAALLGYVEAPDEQVAIERAIEEFRISAELQKRLLAQRRI
jgi:hypothetical protein